MTDSINLVMTRIVINTLVGNERMRGLYLKVLKSFDVFGLPPGPAR